MKIIYKVAIARQDDAPEEARYNAQVLQSIDEGKTFYYAGCGKFFKSLDMIPAWIEMLNLNYERNI